MSPRHMIELHFIFILCSIHVISQKTTYQKIKYFSTEHPNVTRINQKYLKYANLTTQRYGRNNPFYYVHFHWHPLITLDNKFKVDFYFLEYLSNMYKRSFVEMHFNWCDLIERDQFFGKTMRQGPFLKPCPHPPGPYHLYNMTIPIDTIPNSFPFRKGRIVANLTYNSDFMGTGFIDMEIKEFKRKISN